MVDLPANVSITALGQAVSSRGMLTTGTTVLAPPEEIDQTHPDGPR